MRPHALKLHPTVIVFSLAAKAVLVVVLYTVCKIYISVGVDIQSTIVRVR